MIFHARITSPALPNPFTTTGSGSFDVRDHLGSVSLSMNFGNNPQVVKALGGSTLRMREVMAGQTLYFKLPPPLAGRVPGGKPWLKVNLDAVLAARGMPGLSSLQSNPASSDPSQMLQYLRATSGGLTNVGSDGVDGFQTTHYRATIKLDRVADQVPARQRAAVRQGIAALENLTHLHQLPADVWVDGRHLVRRMRLSYAFTLPAGQKLNTLMTIDIPRYGAQPAPALPPANQVTDLTSQVSSQQTG
jgi:hypothetical protein